MSYDIYLADPVAGGAIELPSSHEMRGGTYALGGTRKAWLNVTYNYSPHFRRVLGDDGIRCIYGKTGAETIPLLTEAAAKLGDDVDEDYWNPTEGNAKRALLQLKALAELRPDGVWEGD